MQKGFYKVNKLRNLINKGLNVFDFRVCSTKAELDKAIAEFHYVCTVRSDGKDKGWLYPFYIIRNKADTYKIEFNSDLKYIVANGLRYDTQLRMNLCFKISENGDFLAEYSRLKIPLRKMYEHPNQLTTVYGNLDDKLYTWELGNSTLIDLRELRDILREEWGLMRGHGLFDKYIEMSVYNQNVGVLNKDRVYWEV